MSNTNGESEDEQSFIKENKRPIMTKYATTLNNEKKYPTVLNNGFDKNLVIEKALFDSNTTMSTSGSTVTNNNIPHLLAHTTHSTPLPVSSERERKSTVDSQDVVTHTLTTHTKVPPSLTTSTTSPIVPTLQSVSGPSTPTTATAVNNTSSQSTPLGMKTKSKNEDRRTIKRKKLSPMSSTATPSEVFHRNLVDAVSNVEDSDENEQYVYPYSGNNTDTTAATYHINSKDTLHRTTSSTLYRPQSTRSFANMSQYSSHDPSTRRLSTSAGFLGDFFRPLLFKSKSESRATAAAATTSSLYNKQVQNEDHLLARPKLRSYIMDHPFHSQTKSLHYHHEWLDGNKYSPPLYHKQRPHHHKMYCNYGSVVDGGYTTDDEEAQHLLVPPPPPTPTSPAPPPLPLYNNSRRFQHINKRSNSSSHSSHRKKKSTCSGLLCNLLRILSIMILILLLCLSYFAKPLYDIHVEMGRVLSSDKELIFDLHVNAMNDNIWTVYIADADISVFAFSQVVPLSSSRFNDNRIGVADPAEYLGSFYHFDEPLSFPSTFFFSKRPPEDAISQIRIKSPGADKSGNERWSRMIRYPYGLVVRGVLRYKLFGFLSPYPQSTTICDVVRVNPATGKVTEDPDQGGYCLSYGENATTTATVYK
ncbi:uncharacterized protein BX663DRAFT_507629 [Cokeromyces recurvatus]|uniref:uncharacterized protein n=1 Tax=Cokeromyces recurvatus TaxID=90255 RepID=UPI0022206184|nr:uncharacterized protein BX663DRAFT_507629 [Cokeromyces recurvatus]KAI7903150.1 hypothetical protein BX663DRAFT_507629 [Cokeromyces recurvatus]